MRTSEKMAHSQNVVGVVEKKEKKYPKCVPIAKARAMSKGQRAGAVARKQAKSNTGPTPSRAATFAKRKKAMGGGFMSKRQRMGMI